MKIPSRGAVRYSGKISTNKFDIGKLVGEDDLGLVSFTGDVKGTGFSSSSLDAELDGKFSQLQFNNYDYQDIAVKGRMQKMIKGVVNIKTQFDY